MALPIRSSHFIFDKVNWQLFEQLIEFSEGIIEIPKIESHNSMYFCDTRKLYSKDGWEKFLSLKDHGVTISGLKLSKVSKGLGTDLGDILHRKIYCAFNIAEL
ncbi:hypothetical protein CEXT_746881 [Caerostris extrusa]|uniref:Uncharacterized protein n=1 Tax=Caerostris extrusa TaxID=172846 RepID=A0AAV4QEJ1_CAEEX|nr:hypothetical protein CEXT_746881 [Caerostris extrusa]